MKKILAYLLLAALVMSMALPVSAAVGSPAATPEDLLPFLASSTCDQFKMYSVQDTAELSQDARLIFMEAKESMANAVPKQARVRHFFYADVCEACESCTAVFRAEDYREPMVIQYVDGKWVELEVSVNEDRTITVDGICAGPVAFLVRLAPGLVSSGCDKLTITTEPELEEAPEEIQSVMAAAWEKIPAALPEGMLVRYFFHVDICELCADSTVVFRMESYAELMQKQLAEAGQAEPAAQELLKDQQLIDVKADELVIKQYIDNQWVELTFTINENDGTITVEGVVDGPMAFFVK